MKLTAVDLLIIGAGPVGLTLACEAIRHGMSVRIIDKNEGPSIYSKAQVIHSRTLEIFEDMGIVDKFLDRGMFLTGMRMIADRGSKEVAHVDFSVDDSTYEGFFSLSQRETELVLIEQLAALGVHVERQVRLEAFTGTSEWVRATLIHEASGGQEEIITVPWMVGCDGAHSTVRHRLGFEFSGHTYPMEIIQTDAKVTIPGLLHTDKLLAYMGPHTVCGLFPMPGGRGHYRFLVPTLNSSDEEPTLEDFQAILDEVAPPDSVVSEPEWMVRFRVNCRMVESFQQGRLFLAGDAAHIHSPAGGQGMNMGIQDVYNLAWKLGLVHGGRAKMELLDSYTAERAPVVAQTLAWTDTMTEGAIKNLGIGSEVVLAARNRLAGLVTSLGVVQHKASRALSMLDVGYPDSPICQESTTRLMDAEVWSTKNSEAPTLKSVRAFAHGPKPGQRVPDRPIQLRHRRERRMHELLRGPHHTLFVFDGQGSTQAGYEHMARLGAEVRQRYGPSVHVYLVLPHEERPPELPGEERILLDKAGKIHEIFGVKTEALVLVRPDGYVGFRSQPAKSGPLLSYLSQWLVASNQG